MPNVYELKKRAIKLIEEYLVATPPEKRIFKDILREVSRNTGLGEKFVIETLSSYNMKINSKGFVESEI